MDVNECRPERQRQPEPSSASMMSDASETHSLQSAVPERPSSFLTSDSSLPHHEHTLVAWTCSPGDDATAASCSGLGTVNSPVAPSERPPPSDLWQNVQTMISSPPSSACVQI